jgi:hypothetical protein
MTEKAYKKRMAQHEATFDRLWNKMVDDTNAFIKDNPDKSFASLNNDGFYKLEKFRDALCTSGAWITDRINGYTATHHHPTYQKTLTKKIRKALGYTY